MIGIAQPSPPCVLLPTLAAALAPFWGFCPSARSLYTVLARRAPGLPQHGGRGRLGLHGCGCAETFFFSSALVLCAVDEPEHASRKMG